MSVHIASPCPRLPPPCDTPSPTAPAPYAMAAHPAAVPTAPPTVVLPPRSRRPHPLYPCRVPTSVPPSMPVHGPSDHRAPAPDLVHARAWTQPPPMDLAHTRTVTHPPSCPCPRIHLTKIPAMPMYLVHGFRCWFQCPSEGSTSNQLSLAGRGKRTMARPISRSSRTRISLA